MICTIIIPKALKLFILGILVRNWGEMYRNLTQAGLNKTGNVLNALKSLIWKATKMPSVICLLVLLGASVIAPFSSMLCLHGGRLPVKSKLTFEYINNSRDENLFLSSEE